MQAKSNALSEVRVIAGRWRNSKIPVIDAQGLRPTGNRARETLFNWLTPSITGTRCLDAFAGSGALGLEALSRGASRVDAFEINPAALELLHATHAKLKADGWHIYSQTFLPDVNSVGHQAAQAYDLIFLDPPFGTDMLQRAINRLVGESLVAEGGLIYIEQDAKAAAPAIPAGWSLCKEKQLGAVAMALYRYESAC